MGNSRIEIRYAVLISLLMLLWLALEFLVGLHDTFIAYHPYITMLALIIPVVCARLAVKEKTEELNGRINFKQAFTTGAIVAALAAVFSLPVQVVFHLLINPDFFDNMIASAVKRAELNHLDVAAASADATAYFNLQSYLLMSFAGTLIFGLLIAAFMAWRMRTIK